MDEEQHPDPPTGNIIQLDLSQLCELIQSRSEEDQPGPSRPINSDELKKLKEEVDIVLTDLVQHQHHKQFLSTAIKSNTPPPGLTPKLNLTAKGQTDALTTRVTSILKESGLQVTFQLLEHHGTMVNQCKQKADDIRKKMEAIAHNAPSPAEKEKLAELAKKLASESQEKAKKMALDLKDKRERRKRDREDKTSSDSPNTKKTQDGGTQ